MAVNWNWNGTCKIWFGEAWWQLPQPPPDISDVPFAQLKPFWAYDFQVSLWQNAFVASRIILPGNVAFTHPYSPYQQGGWHILTIDGIQWPLNVLSIMPYMSGATVLYWNALVAFRGPPPP